jgi:hypothetical protein
VAAGGVKMRQFGDNTIRPLSSTYMVSLALSVLARVSVVQIPLFGIEVGIPVSTGFPGSVDVGTPTNPLSWEKNPGSTYYYGLDFFGLGIVLHTGDFRFAMVVKPGYRYLRMSGTLTQNLLTVDAEAHQYSFSFRGDVEACFAMTSIASGCLFVAPHLYEFDGWLNGGVGGLRFESN